MTTQNFLITGATGKTGKRVARLLRDQGHEIREGSRGSEIPFDWNNPATWDTALAGISAMYIVVPDLGYESAVSQVHAFARMAFATGVKRAVLISYRDTGGGNIQVVQRTERAMADSGLALTILRLRWFSQNFSEFFQLDSILAGDIRFPAADGREAYVDLDDVAEVAVATLTGDLHIGKVYELTGPRPLSFGQIADELSRATGRTINYTPLNIDEFVAEQTALGVPQEAAEGMGTVYSFIGSGELDNTTNDIETVLGKPARDFTEYATTTAATGVWNV
jgi:uncharacterized protein YbjT (DUF2867 family)